MTRTRPRAVLTANLREHPAVVAWNTVADRSPIPHTVAVLRERQPPHKAIYRLTGVGRDGGSVIAKRAVRDIILLERRVYEQVLPEVPVTAPHYYGSETAGAQGWLLLEDMGDTRLSNDNAEQRRLVAQWVATLHRAARDVAAGRTLPDAGPSRYLGQLRATRAKIHTCLGQGRLPRREIDVLVSLLSDCESIEAQWHTVEAGCRDAPATVVHGDFQPKNVFVRNTPRGLGVFPIDWEMAGWGSPVVDLARIDVDAYGRAIRGAWPGADQAAVVRWARFGALMGMLAAVDWECEFLRLKNRAYRSEAVANLAHLHDKLFAAARGAQIVVRR